ncbi:VOC family protein [Pseudomonadota bacterium]
MQIKSILHTSVLVSDLEASLSFYCDILGLSVDPSRPELGYGGVWLDVCAQQQIHLLVLDNPDPIDGRPEHGGRDRHTAMAVSEVDSLILTLEEAGIPYTRSRSGRGALFCRDPDGNALEFIPVV